MADPDLTRVSSTPTPPRVVAVVVSSNSADTVVPTLRTLAAQQYPNLDVIAVDNGSTDGTVETLKKHLGMERVIVNEQPEGFGRCVHRAVEHVLDKTDYVLCVHDDMAFMPDAVQWLVETLEDNQRMWVAGPKLRAWADDPILQDVGVSADLFVNQEPRVDDRELDQGQFDHRADVLSVSTAGMMLRAKTFEQVGGFDPRYSFFGDDVDLCWRVWLAGHSVSVVPEAVAYHSGLASEDGRPEWDEPERRYHILRHALTTGIKNFGASRLTVSVTLGLLWNLVAATALLLSRRWGEAISIIRAYGWTLRHLSGTLQRRRKIQAERRVSDTTLAALFTRGIPRITRYRESLLEVISGGDTRALVDDEEFDRASIDPLAGMPMQRFVRDRPLLLFGTPLLVAFGLSLLGFLGAGPIIGGEIGAWPENTLSFLTQYVSPWDGEPLASGSFPSPAKAILGVMSLLGFGNPWLAQRIIVFGLVPLAFVSMYLAGRRVTSVRWPRVLGGVVYALSPVLLTAIGRGVFSHAVVAAILPMIVSVALTTADWTIPRAEAWRGTALLGLGLVVAVGTAPVAGLLAVGIVAVILFGTVLRFKLRAALRLITAAVMAAVVLSPWAYDLWRLGGPGSSVVGTHVGAVNLGTALWRSALGVVDIPGLDPVLAWGMVIIPVAVIVGGLVVAMPVRPLVTGTLISVTILSGVGTWAVPRFGLPVVSPLTVAIPGAVALAVLTIVVSRWLITATIGRDFGFHHVAVGLISVGFIAGVLASMVMLATGPWTGLNRSPTLLPAFIGVDVEETGPYRVLILNRNDAGNVTWELVDAEGPQMTSFGTLRNEDTTALIEDTIGRVTSGDQPTAADRLGLSNIKYVVLSRPDQGLQEALGTQASLSPLATTAAVTYEVSNWLPRAGTISGPPAEQLLRTGVPGDTAGYIENVLPRGDRPGVYVGSATTLQDDLLVVTEDAAGYWRGLADGEVLERVEIDDVNVFVMPEGTHLVRTGFSNQFRRRALVAGQLLVLLLLVSVAIRPPGQRTERAERGIAVPRALREMAGEDDPFEDYDEAEEDTSFSQDDTTGESRTQASVVAGGDQPGSDDTEQFDRNEYGQHNIDPALSSASRYVFDSHDEAPTAEIPIIKKGHVDGSGDQAGGETDG